MNRLECRRASFCSGCDHLDLDRSQLKERRFQTLRDLGIPTSADEGVELSYQWIGTGALRDRLEFTLDMSSISSPRLGLFRKRSEDSSFKEFESPPPIVDIDECPQLSPALQSWLTEFRKDLPPVARRGSVRLRVSPKGARGVWLDFSNEDIKSLLDESAWIQRQLAQNVVVEMGQKRKRVETATDATPRAHRLVDPKLEPWFETVAAKEATPIFGAIGTFTQAGFRANRVLAETVLKFANGRSKSFRGSKDTSPAPQDSPVQDDFLRGLTVAEFGAGTGSFTLPLLAAGATTHVFESDPLALAGLKMGVAAQKNIDPQKLKIHAGDFILSTKSILTAEATTDFPQRFDLVVVDPPRPGLGHFATKIFERAQDARWIYVSCFPESFARDLEALKALGLKLERLAIVEQFPFTRHFEIVASFAPARDSNFT